MTVPARDRKRLERLSRTIARPPLANERLAGQRYEHQSGQVMGDPFEAYSPSAYRARPLVLRED